MVVVGVKVVVVVVVAVVVAVAVAVAVAVEVEVEVEVGVVVAVLVVVSVLRQTAWSSPRSVAPLRRDIAFSRYAGTSLSSVISAGAKTRKGGPQKPVPRET